MPLHGIPRFRPRAKVRVPRISCCKVGKKHLQTRGRLVKKSFSFLNWEQHNVALYSVPLSTYWRIS